MFADLPTLYLIVFVLLVAGIVALVSTLFGIGKALEDAEAESEREKL